VRRERGKTVAGEGRERGRGGGMKKGGWRMTRGEGFKGRDIVVMIKDNQRLTYIYILNTKRMLLDIYGLLGVAFPICDK
jgi:hypothetical protein